MSFYLPLFIQDDIFLFQRTVFIISFILNIILLICLLKQTPPHQATFKNYVILIQVLLTLSDINLDIFFAPIPLFPIPAGYCVGLLCKANVSMRLQLGSTILVFTNTGVSIIICVLYRHQTILLENNLLKLKKRTKHIIRSWLFILFSIAPIALMLQSDDEMEMEAMIESNPHNITWIRERGMHMIVEKTSDIVVIIYTILLVLFIIFSSLIFMFGHMFIVLQINTNNRSKENTRRVRRSLLVLLIQLIVPLQLLVFPATIMFIGLLNENWITFEISLVVYLTITLHSIGHNVILLLITPLYRNFIVHFIARHVLRRRNIIPQKPMSAIQVTVTR